MSKKEDLLLVFSKKLSIFAVLFSATVIIGITACSFAMDVLALGKSKNQSVTISINQINELAGALDDGEIIEHPLLFSAYVKLSELLGKSVEIKNHSATVNSNMDYSNILSAFTSPPPVKIVTLEFPKSSTTDQIIDIFVKNGIGTREGFENVINSYPFEYDFIAQLDKKMSGDRLYRLDGYLYPDTYEFYTGRSEAYYIYKMLDRFCAAVSEIGVDFPTDDTIILASMVELSGANVSSYEYLSAVFSNRLKNPEDYPFLNCPASSAYALKSYGIFIGAPTDEIINADTPYNTFKSKGLPPSAICNPDKNAILAALYPADCSYKYFLTLPSGEVVFSATEREYNKYIEEYFG